MTTLLSKKAKAITFPIDLGDGIFLDKILITPNQAKTLLGNSIGNRRLSKPLIESLERAMLNGEYNDRLFDPIRITADHKLTDGHHRLTAMVNTETSHESLILSGYDFEEFIGMDQNKARTNADTLYLLRKDHYNYRAGVARWMYRFLRYETSQGNHRYSISNPLSVAIDSHLNESNEGLDAIKYFQETVSKMLKLPIAPSVALILLHKSIDSKACVDFWEGLALGKDNALINDGDPRKAIRHKIETELSKRGTTSKPSSLAPSKMWTEDTMITSIHYAFKKFTNKENLYAIKLQKKSHARIWGELNQLARRNFPKINAEVNRYV